MNQSYKYARMSTAGQTFSPEFQDQVCNEYHGNNPRLPPLFQEQYIDAATSGSVAFADRPAGKALLLKMQRGDHLIVASFDRIGRDQVDMITTVRLLHKRGIFVHILDMVMIATLDPNDAMSEMMLAQFAAFAQFQRKQVSVKTKQALAAKKALGYSVSGLGTPIGYKKTLNPAWSDSLPDAQKRCIGRYLITPCPQAQDYFDTAYRMWFGGESVPEILRHLRNHPDAANWKYTRLYRFLKAERARRNEEYMRQQRSYIMSGGKKPEIT